MVNFFDTIPAQSAQRGNFFDDIPEGPEGLGQDSPLNNMATAGVYNFAKSVPFAEKAAAAVTAPIKSMISGGGLEGVVPAYNETRDEQKRLSNAMDISQPTASTTGMVGGALLNPANWVLGKAGLVANAGLQAGSDTDFSKDNAGTEFAEKGLTNFALGKALQKVAGAVTGSETMQKAGNVLSKKLNLDDAAKTASRLAKIGASDAPLAVTGGQDAVDIAVPTVRNSKIADKIAEPIENLKKYIGSTSKSEMDSKLKGGLLKEEATKLYDQPKKIQATDKYWDDNLPDIAKPYIKAAQDQFPGVVQKYGEKSGAIVKEAMKLAGKSGSVENAMEVKKALTKFSGGIFNEADEAYNMASSLRRQSAPVLTAAKQGAARAEQQELDAATKSKLAKTLTAVPKGIGSMVGMVTRGIANPKGSPKVQAKIADLLLGQSTGKASATISKSRRNLLDALLQTNNRNASAIEQYIPYAGMKLKERR